MLKGYKPTAHLIKDREERLFKISQTIGFGEVYRVFPHRDHSSKQMVLTTSGAVLITSRTTVITIYACDIDLAKAMFKGDIPKEIKATIVYNMKKYPDLWD